MIPESILVDSDVFIDYFKLGKDPTQELLERYDSTDLVTCGVVKAEVLRGIKSLKAKNKLASFFSVMRFSDLSAKTWDSVWELAWNLDRKGRVLPLTDIAIATCALKSGAWVLTSDAHFDSIPDLTVIRPGF